MDQSIQAAVRETRVQLKEIERVLENIEGIMQVVALMNSGVISGAEAQARINAIVGSGKPNTQQKV